MEAQSLEEDPKLKGLEEEEDPKSQSLKEDEPTSQSLEEGPKSNSLEEDPNLQSLKEEDPNLQSLKEEDPNLQSLKEEDPKSQSLEEEEPKAHRSEEEEGRDGFRDPRFNDSALQFLDSMDGYLTLMDTLSWTLRQGWLQLASARHSMGGSRVSSAVLDMKSHSAATFLQVTKQANPGAGIGEIHHFTLRKWASSDNGNGAPDRDVSPQLRQRKDKDEAPPPGTDEDDYQHKLQKERFKSLSVFGALVSPKLRAAQLSFETALEALVEIANMRSSMLSNFHEVRKELESEKGKQ